MTALDQLTQTSLFNILCEDGQEIDYFDQDPDQHVCEGWTR